MGNMVNRVWFQPDVVPMERKHALAKQGVWICRMALVHNLRYVVVGRLAEYCWFDVYVYRNLYASSLSKCQG